MSGERSTTRCTAQNIYALVMTTSKPPASPEPPAVPELELEKDVDFQQKQWVFQRVAWLLMLAIVVLGLLGLFGSGPLSAATLETNEVKLEYERFARANDPTQLRFELQNIAPGKVLVRLDRDLLEHISIETVQPEPAAVQLEADWVAYAFDVTEPTSSAIRFIVTRDSAGVLATRVKVNSGATLELWQFAFP
jgi:hypothetical protein